MIKNPKWGWCDFSLGNFQGTPSYITNVPIDLLQAFITYYETGNSAVCFDEEGSEFTLVLSCFDVYIIEAKDTPILHYFEDIKIDDLCKELISDIEDNMQGWLKFLSYDTPENNRIKLEDMISQLKTIIKDKEKQYE